MHPRPEPLVDRRRAVDLASGAEANPAEILAQQNARLAALHEVTLGLTSTLELPEVLQRVADMAQSLSAAAHAHIFLYDAADDSLLPAASHWSAADRVVRLEPRRTGVTHEVARTGQAIFIEDTALHPAYAPMNAEQRPGAMACLPLAKGSRVLGTLNLGYWTPHHFDRAMRDFLELMARHAAIAIESAHLIQLAAERARLEQDLATARQIQASLIPGQTPCLAGWDFGAFWQPAQQVGGDFYDFVPIAGTSQLGIIMADVSDKGIPAALFMAVARSTLRASLTAACCAADCVAHANRLLSADAVNAMFVTGFYGQLEPATGELTYVNAGHNPPLLYHQATGDFQALARTGMALAVDQDSVYDQVQAHLDLDDFVVLYTDGVTDAIDGQRQPFGLRRLRQSILAQREATAEQIVAGIRQALNEHVGAQPPFDDISVVVVKHDASRA